MTDVYQDRYLEHRNRKAATLAGEVTVVETGSDKIYCRQYWGTTNNLYEV